MAETKKKPKLPECFICYRTIPKKRRDAKLVVFDTEKFCSRSCCDEYAYGELETTDWCGYCEVWMDLRDSDHYEGCPESDEEDE